MLLGVFGSVNYGGGLNRGDHTVHHPGEFKLWFQEKRQVSSCPCPRTDIRSQAAIYLSSCPDCSAAETLKLKLPSWYLFLYRAQSGHFGGGV